jgi:tricorn protease
MIRNASLSPTGVRAAFEARGDIFTVPAEKGDYRNLTRSTGAHDRSPVWSPDGTQLAWFSDVSGEYQLMIGDQNGLAKPRAISLPVGLLIARLVARLKFLLFRIATSNSGQSMTSARVTAIDTDTYYDPGREMEAVSPVR